ncbi:hypothetical protein [Gymnodinialimonas ulvae]|uniref:hypothetical protein n=1 Tax=Gymnodinialimonas ulvae TaxID=3126504 RepID=UPI0030B31543
MRTGIIIAAVAIALLAIGGAYMVDIDQTQDGELPEVSVEGGQLPEFDAEVGDVEVTEETVTVPSIEVTPPEADDS